MPEISIVVPVYNVEKYIRRCVDSILCQTFADLEIILVDDGSPDNCPIICDEYAQKDDRVHVIHKNNGGVSSARNNGIDVAHGKYVMFCDGDDYVDEYWCETLYQKISKHPGAWVLSDVWIVHSDGHYQSKTEIEHAQIRSSHESLTYYDIYKFGLSGYPVNKIYNCDTLKQNKIRFDPEIEIGEDVKFNVDYFHFCDNIIYVDKPYYYYCENSESATHRYRPDRIEAMLLPFYIRLPLIDNQHVNKYCDHWLAEFIQEFEIVFDQRNKAPLWKKLRYNQRMLNTKEFKFCLEHASGQNESALVMQILKTHNYYLYWLHQQAVKIKNLLSVLVKK